uniref:calcyphosin-2 n=1 Tax=Myxine glutinosa TaxID=7769 RepID=UPI00358EB439
MCFDARLITRCGREACRELFGFFFAFDSSLTVYEYRHFGKNRCCILPLVPRGKYTHQIGVSSHQPYALCDLYVGADLAFAAKDLPCLPEMLRSHRLLTMRITDLDQGARDRIMRDFPTHLLTTNHQNKEKKLPPALCQDNLRPYTLASLLCLGPLLAQAAGSGHITKPLVARALQASGLHLTEQKFAALWSYVTQAAHTMDGHDAVLHGLRGNMTENRKALVRKAYVNLDPNKVGAISTCNIMKFYAARGRPPALPGEVGEAEVRAALLRVLKLVFKDPQSITYGEFDDLHEVLSLGITDDSRFASLMRVTWGI